MHSVHGFEGVPGIQLLDPPFRKIDVSDNSAVRTVVSLLRAAWKAAPQAKDVSGDAEQEDTSTGISGPSGVVWSYMRKYSHLSDTERAVLPQADKDDVQSRWRTIVYLLWNHVFFDTAAFLQDVNGMTIGHWHPEFAEAHPDEALGQLVLHHGQTGGAAVQHRFHHNVLVTTAFLDVGVSVRGARLPMDGSETGYVLEDHHELDSWDKDSGDIIWFVRRDVPVEFHVEPSRQENGEIVDRAGVAAVLIYGNLCLEAHASVDEGELATARSDD